MLILDESLEVEMISVEDVKISGSSLNVECLGKAVSVLIIVMLPVVVEGSVELLIVFPGEKNYYFV